MTRWIKKKSAFVSYVSACLHLKQRTNGIQQHRPIPFYLLLILGLSLSGCGGGGSSPSPAPSVVSPPAVKMAPVTLTFSMPRQLAKPSVGRRSSPAPVAVNSIRVTVTATDITPGITQLLIRDTDFGATSTVAVTLQVPVGTDRVFTVLAFGSADGSGDPIFQGATTGVAIVSGTNNIAIILAAPPFSAPTITSFSPASGCSGTSVVITGTNFDPIPANNTVFFLGDVTSTSTADDRKADITAVTSTQVTVDLPVDAVTGTIRIANLLGSATSTGSFSFLCSQPTILFKSQFNLSSNTGSSYEPSVAISGDTVITAWYDDAQGNFDIFIAKSIDGGVTFSPSVNLSNNAGGSYSPSVAISGTTVIASWYDDTLGNLDVFIAKSTDGGANFSTPVNISSNAGDSYEPSVVISGETVIVIWYDDTPTNFDVFVARSTDGGGTFSTPVNLSSSAGVSGGAAVAISGATVIASWHDDTAGNFDIFTAKSIDGGANFTTPVNFSSNTGGSYSPSVAISGSTVIVAWYDDILANFDIFVSRSTDGGVTFFTAVNPSNNNTGASTNPFVAISGATVITAWYDDTEGNYDIFIAKSIDGGGTFSSPSNLSKNTGASAYPSVGISGAGTIITAWHDSTPGVSDIFLARLE